MSANRREAFTLLRFQLIKREVSDAQRTLALLESGYEDLQEEVRDTDRVLAAGSARLAQIARQNRSVVAPSYNELRASIEGAAEAQQQLNRNQQAAGGNRLFGISRGATQLGSLASGLGIGGAGQALRLVDDISDAAAALPELKKAIASIPPVAGVAGIALGALVLALNEVNRQAAELEAATRARLDAEAEVIRFEQAATTQMLQDRIKAAQTEIAIEQAVLEARRQAAQEAARAEGFGGGFLEGLLGGIVNTAPVLRGVVEEFQETEQVLGRLQTELTGLLALQDSQVVALNDEAAARTQLLALQQANTDRQIQNEIRVLSTISQSSEALDQRIEAINREQEVLQDYLAAGNLSAELTTQLTNRMIDLSAEESLLAIRIRPIIAAREEEAAALAFQQQQLEEVSAAIKSYNTDVARIEQKALEDRANAQDKFNKALVSAAEAAADAAENALQKLIDKRAELAQDFARGEIDVEKEQRQEALDRQIEAQRDEARALRDHQREIQDIIRESQREEEDLIANRDFAGLFRLRRDTGRRIEDANRAFNDERADRIEAYRQQQQDAVDQYTREREQRQAKYLQDLADAQVQYDRELVQVEVNRLKARLKAQQAYNEELRLLGEKLRADLNARRQAYDIEIQMAAQTSAVRQQILMKELQFAQMVLASIGKGGASGASASGMSVPGGNNTSIRGGASFNQTNNISGAANPDAISRLIDQRARRMLEIELGAA